MAPTIREDTKGVYRLSSFGKAQALNPDPSTIETRKRKLSQGTNDTGDKSARARKRLIGRSID